MFRFDASALMRERPVTCLVVTGLAAAILGAIGYKLGVAWYDGRTVSEINDEAVEKINALTKEYQELVNKGEKFPSANLYKHTKELRNLKFCTKGEKPLADKIQRFVRCVELLDAHHQGAYRLNQEEIEDSLSEAAREVCEHKSESQTKKEAKKAEKEAKKAEKEAKKKAA